VSIVPYTRYEDERPTGASPIEYFQSHIVVDGDELNFVWGQVVPYSGFLCVKRIQK
jgi:hypothetical protein